MDPHFSKPMLAGACALMMTGCTYPHPGPTPPDEQPLPAVSGQASSPANSASQVKAKPDATKSTSLAPANKSAVNNSTNASTVNTSMPTPKSKPVTSPPILLDSGADTVKPSGQMPTAASTENSSDFDNLELVDASLKEKLEVQRVGSEPTPNNLLSVFVGVKNKTTQRLDLEFQTLYKDKSGNALNEGSWIPMILKAHEESEYHSASISPDATDFIVRIRLSREP